MALFKGFRLLTLRGAFSQIFTLTSIVVAVALVSSCSPIVDNRGHVEDDPIDKAIKVDVTTQDEVLRQFGSPSSVSTFGPETWYYISSRKERKAFFKPKIVEQHVTEIEFAGDGVVKRMQSYKMEDGKKINVVEATTPTEGHKLGFFEQIMANLGRFNNKPRQPSPGAAHP